MDEKSTRFCIRLNKQLGWHCCNEIRIQLNCPAECNYAPKAGTENASPFPGVKTDSRSEFTDFFTRYANIWIHLSNNALDGKTPAQTAQQNPKQLEQWLNGYRFPDERSARYLYDRLNMEFPTATQSASDPEDVAERYFEHIVELDWKAALSLHFNYPQDKELQEQFIETFRTNPLLKKTVHWQILSSGMSQEGNVSFVSVEINRKHEWLLILRQTDGTWKIKQNIKGSIQDYYHQNKVYAGITNLLANAKTDEAWTLCDTNRDIYPDSPDCFYYRGLIEIQLKRNDAAKTALYRSIALDETWDVPRFHLASVYLAEKNYDEAIDWYDSALSINPNDTNSLNNLAICYLAKAEKDKAIELFRKVVELDPNHPMATKNLELLTEHAD